MITYIKKVDVKTIFEASNIDYILSEYFKLASVGLLDNYKVNREAYYNLELLGSLDSFGVYDKEDNLVGLCFTSTNIAPHYSVLITNVMSIFVLPSYRKFGTAKRLLSEVELSAAARGSSLLLVSSPINKTMGKYVTKIGYKPSNILYGKRLQ